MVNQLHVQMIRCIRVLIVVGVIALMFLFVSLFIRSHSWQWAVGVTRRPM